MYGSVLKMSLDCVPWGVAKDPPSASWGHSGQTRAEIAVRFGYRARTSLLVLFPQLSKPQFPTLSSENKSTSCSAPSEL